MRTHCEEMLPASDQYHLVIIHHSEQFSAIWDSGKGNSTLQIRLFKVIHIPRLTTHFILSVYFDASGIAQARSENDF
jgi:hypothetical protein